MSDNKQLYIPKKLKVGFQKRSDTYGGALAYVIYYDDKGKLRKEASWESWRDKKITSVECENAPTEGFVLNKKVGGYKSEWNFRDAHIRVYDPRGFEFEISVPNLLFILREGDCSRGKGLEGKFVYGWQGTELVLLPVSSAEYRQSAEFTDLQAQKIVGKNLIPGATYLTKKQEELVFVGRYAYHYVVREGGEKRYDDPSPKDDKGVCKKYVFWRPDLKKDGFVYADAPSKIGVLKSETAHPDFAALVTKYGKSQYGSRVVSLRLKSGKPPKDGYYRDDGIWYAEDKPGVFAQLVTHAGYDKTVHYISHTANYFLDDAGRFVREAISGVTYYPKGKEPSRYRQYNYTTGKYDEPPPTLKWREPTTMQLFATLESGAEVQVGYGNFDKKKG